MLKELIPNEFSIIFASFNVQKNQFYSILRKIQRKVKSFERQQILKLHYVK